MTSDNTSKNPAGFLFIPYLMITVFVTGAIIMLIEVLGARVITPYFGSSLFVWTAVISVTLLSLAIGYYYGGRVADKTSSANALYGAILVSGVYLFFAIFIKKPSLTLAADLGLRMGSLAASTILFAPPIFLLGMVSPLAVKLYTDTTETLGSHVGLLYALSTIGSFLGTILTGFVLIPLFGVSKILIAAANVLIAMALIYFFMKTRNMKWLLVLSILALNVFFMQGEGLSSMVIGNARWQELYKTDSLYARLKVVERNNKFRGLLMDGAFQGGAEINSGAPMEVYFYVMDSLAYTFNPEMKNVLIVGLGAGMNAGIFSKKGAHVDVVEIDPKVTDIYRKYFAVFGDQKNVRIYEGDGRRFIRQSSKKYDVIIMDVFLGDSTPWHLLTREAVIETKKILSDDGVLLFNLVTAPKDDSARKIVNAIHRTLLEEFPHVSVFNSRGMLPKGEVQNIYFAASRGKLFMDRPFNTYTVHPVFLEDFKKIINDRIDSPEDGSLVLTDDYNPIEFYNANVKEIWRREMMQCPEKDILLN